MLVLFKGFSFNINNLRGTFEIQIWAIVELDFKRNSIDFEIERFTFCLNWGLKVQHLVLGGKALHPNTKYTLILKTTPINTIIWGGLVLFSIGGKELQLMGYCKNKDLWAIWFKLQIMITYITWRFPKVGVPLNHPFQ